jgi:hypothetical protein
MMEKVLELYFVTSDGKTAKVSVEDPIDNLDSQAISAAMNEMLSSGIFITKTGTYTSKKEARIVEKTTTSYSF